MFGIPVNYCGFLSNSRSYRFIVCNRGYIIESTDKRKLSFQPREQLQILRNRLCLKKQWTSWSSEVSFRNYMNL